METNQKRIIDAARNQLLTAIRTTLSTHNRYSALGLSLLYQPHTGKHILSMNGIDLASARERINYRTMDIVLRMKYLNLQPLNRPPRPISFELMGIDALSAREQAIMLAREVAEVLEVIDIVLVDKGIIEPLGA